MYNVKERDLDGYPIGGYINENNRISGFQWALTIFVFFIVTMALTLILRDYQPMFGVKPFI